MAGRLPLGLLWDHEIGRYLQERVPCLSTTSYSLSSSPHGPRFQAIPEQGEGEESPQEIPGAPNCWLH